MLEQIAILTMYTGRLKQVCETSTGQLGCAKASYYNNQIKSHQHRSLARLVLTINICKFQLSIPLQHSTSTLAPFNSTITCHHNIPYHHNIF